MYPINNGYHFPPPHGFAHPGAHAPPFYPQHPVALPHLPPSLGPHGQFNQPSPRHQDHQTLYRNGQRRQHPGRPHHPYRRNPTRRQRNQRRRHLETARHVDDDELDMDYVIDEHELNFDERDSNSDEENAQRVVDGRGADDDDYEDGVEERRLEQENVDRRHGHGREERHENAPEEGHENAPEEGHENAPEEGHENVPEERQGNGREAEDGEGQEAVQNAGPQQQNVFNGRPDRTFYTLAPPAPLTHAHIQFLVQRADQLAVQPRPTVRDQPTDVFVSLMPTHMSPQLALEWIGHVYRISPQHWQHHSTRPSLIRGVPDTLEHIYRVQVSSRNDIPLGRTCWKSVFTPTVLRAGRGILFHALSESEMIRLMILGGYAEVYPNIGNTLSDDHRQAVGDVATIQRAWRDPNVRLRVRSVLLPIGIRRLEEELAFIEFYDNFNQRYPQ